MAFSSSLYVSCIGDWSKARATVSSTLTQHMSNHCTTSTWTSHLNELEASVRLVPYNLCVFVHWHSSLARAYNWHLSFSALARFFLSSSCMKLQVWALGLQSPALSLWHFLSCIPYHSTMLDFGLWLTYWYTSQTRSYHMIISMFWVWYTFIYIHYIIYLRLWQYFVWPCFLKNGLVLESWLIWPLYIFVDPCCPSLLVNFRVFQYAYTFFVKPSPVLLSISLHPCWACGGQTSFKKVIIQRRVLYGCAGSSGTGDVRPHGVNFRITYDGSLPRAVHSTYERRIFTGTIMAFSAGADPM